MRNKLETISLRLCFFHLSTPVVHCTLSKHPKYAKSLHIQPPQIKLIFINHFSTYYTTMHVSV